MARKLPEGTNHVRPQRHTHFDGGLDHQEQNYHKGAVGGGRHGSMKEIHEDAGTEFRMTGGGADTHGNSGPTGSSRIYPKRGRDMGIVHHTDWNPMLLQPSTYGICGMEHHEARSHGRGRHE